MDKKTLIGGLAEFINGSPNAYIACANIARLLDERGFSRISEGNGAAITRGGKYYCVRADSSLIAFIAGSEPGFMIAAAHTDSPALRLKPNFLMTENGYAKLNTDVYGGPLFYSWLDRPLSLAGRALFRNGDELYTRLFDLKRPIAVIPSVAIHQNREVNKSLSLNPQTDLIPICGLSGAGLMQLIESECGACGGFVDGDLFLYCTEPAVECGANGEFIVGPRLDDLACIYPLLCAFAKSSSRATNVFCAFNNEEIGSRTMQGADSSFLSDVLTMIDRSLGFDHAAALGRAFAVSADNGHALHPDSPDKSDPTNKVLPGGDIVIKRHDHYTTDGFSSSVFKLLCDKAGAKYQDFACRSDISCGGTLGAISQSHVSIPTVDVGLPQLAMHSAVETMGSGDAADLYLAGLELYSSTIDTAYGRISLIK